MLQVLVDDKGFVVAPTQYLIDIPSVEVVLALTVLLIQRGLHANMNGTTQRYAFLLIRLPIELAAFRVHRGGHLQFHTTRDVVCEVGHLPQVQAEQWVLLPIFGYLESAFKIKFKKTIYTANNQRGESFLLEPRGLIFGRNF